MNVRRRLVNLEGSLSPGDIVLIWLREAHQAGSLEAYVRSIVVRAEPRYPLDWIRREVQARIDLPTSRRLAKAHDRLQVALEDAHVLYELAIGLDARAQQKAVELTALALYFLARLEDADWIVWSSRSTSTADLEGATAERPSLATSTADTFFAHARATAVEVRTEESARRLLEGTWFRGTNVLFPSTSTAWQQLGWALARMEASLAAQVPDQSVVRDASFGVAVAARAEEIFDDARMAVFAALGEADPITDIHRARAGKAPLPIRVAKARPHSRRPQSLA